MNCLAQPIGWLLAAPSPIGSPTPLLVQPIGSLLAAPSPIGSPTPQGSHSRSAASWLLAAPHPQRGCWIGVERVQCECQAHARGSAWTRANLNEEHAHVRHRGTKRPHLNLCSLLPKRGFGSLLTMTKYRHAKLCGRFVGTSKFTCICVHLDAGGAGDARAPTANQPRCLADQVCV